MKGNWHQSLSVVSSSFISWPIVMKEMQFDQPPYQTSFQYFMLENHKIQPKNQLKLASEASFDPTALLFEFWCQKSVGLAFSHFLREN